MTNSNRFLGEEKFEEWIPYAEVKELQEMMEVGKLTSSAIVRLLLRRIEAYDQQHKSLNSVLEINPEAISIAESLDRERLSQGSRGNLHGIPILLKDNIDTLDKMHTSAGSIALADHYGSNDAFIVKKLRDAGVVIIGKTNMSEWANYMTSGMPEGYSSRGGNVLNPYGPQKFTVGGSSSGSAVAVASGFIPLAVGTETLGSIIIPAIHNSIVGIKPTVGLMSRNGIIPISHSQDTPGPLARTVTDAAYLLNAMVGYDPQDSITQNALNNVNQDYTSNLDKSGLVGARIGIPRRVFYDYLNEEEKQMFNRHIENIRDAGAIIIDPADIPSADKLFHFRSSVLKHEFKVNINVYLSKLAPDLPVHSLRELINFNEQDPIQRMRYGQSALIAANKTPGNLTNSQYILDRLKDLQLSRVEGIDAVIKEHRLDAILFPSFTGIAFTAKSGYPSIAIPAGYTLNGKPFGVCFSGSPYSELNLIKFAYAFEQHFRLRTSPIL